ncbi:MAG: hypothetical protein OSJ70_04480 [Bacilli bacterium]|nr:hypothetical protein [Bacilli bacterium]
MLIKNIEADAQSFNLLSNAFYGGRGGTQDTYVKNRETLDIIVDAPCLEACQYLFDCNILTLASSANKNDITSDLAYSKGFITIDYSSLDESNKEIFNKLVESGLIILGEDFEKRRKFNLEVSITEDTTVEEFSNKMLSLAYNFQPQQILYGCYTLEAFQNYVAEKLLNAKTMEGRNFCDILLENLNNGKILEEPSGEVEIQDGRRISLNTLCHIFANEFGYFYDEEEQKYWIDKELHEKAQIVKKSLQAKDIRK